MELSQQRTIVAEEMSKKIKEASDEMLGVYRENFVKMSDLLKQAELKET